MARRTTSRMTDYDEDGGYPRRRRPQKRGSEGLILAVGAAVVVGLVFVLLVSSGSSGGVEKAAAKQKLRDLFQTFVNGDVAKGSAMIDPRQILSSDNGEGIRQQMQSWDTLSEKAKQGYREEVWNFLCSTANTDLDLKSMNQADTILSSATLEWDAAHQEVDIDWTYLGKPWRAKIQKTDQGYVILNMGQNLI